MNVPKLRFKEFTDEWNTVDLSKTFNYFSTNSLSRDKLANNGIIKNIHYGDIHKKYGCVVDIDKEVSSYIKDLNYNNIYEKCRNNDLIFADASEDYDGIGKAIEIINVNESIVSGLHTILARDKSKAFSPMFKGYYFNSPIIHNQIRVQANGFKVFGISKETINSLNAKIPNKEEQTKIANFLSLLDKKIELQTKKIEDLKLYKKGLISKFKNNNLNWNNYKISELFTVTRGVVIPKTELRECIDEEYKYPVYSSQTSNNGILGYDNKYDFEGKYLTWTTDGANAGKVFYRRGKFRCTNVCGILYNNKNEYVDELTAELLNYITPKHVSYIGNPKLMNNVMVNINIQLPNISESVKISNILNMINTKIDKENNKLISLQKLKKGLMQSMFV